MKTKTYLEKMINIDSVLIASFIFLESEKVKRKLVNAM